MTTSADDTMDQLITLGQINANQHSAIKVLRRKWPEAAKEILRVIEKEREESLHRFLPENVVDNLIVRGMFNASLNLR